MRRTPICVVGIVMMSGHAALAGSLTWPDGRTASWPEAPRFANKAITEKSAAKRPLGVLLRARRAQARQLGLVQASRTQLWLADPKQGNVRMPNGSDFSWRDYYLQTSQPYNNVENRINQNVGIIDRNFNNRLDALGKEQLARTSKELSAKTIDTKGIVERAQELIRAIDGMAQTRAPAEVVVGSGTSSSSRTSSSYGVSGGLLSLSLGFNESQSSAQSQSQWTTSALLPGATAYSIDAGDKLKARLIAGLTLYAANTIDVLNAREPRAAVQFADWYRNSTLQFGDRQVQVARAGVDIAALDSSGIVSPGFAGQLKRSFDKKAFQLLK